MNESQVIHPVYLPFSPDDLRPHFLADADAHIRRFEKSAQRYASAAVGPGSNDRRAQQIEKDETFWTACALKALVSQPDALPRILADALGPVPPLHAFSTWDECIDGGIHLYLEAALPSPPCYKAWLAANLKTRHLVPHILTTGAATVHLEGPTHVDAVILNPSNGFGIIIEAKVLSDISSTITFDLLRNQLIRNIDVMLEQTSRDPQLARRMPEHSVFLLLTPQLFRQRPESRLYGWLFRDYTHHPDSIARDLPHRAGIDVEAVARRIGWTTFEAINDAAPGACRWIPTVGV